MLPGMKRLPSTPNEEGGGGRVAKKRGNRLSTFSGNMWKKRGGNATKQNKKIPSVGGTELVNTVFLDTSAVESKLSESPEDDMDEAEEKTILEKKLTYSSDFYLLELPVVN